jgi:uncharacterized membrane protein (DUF373 family)
VSSYERSLGKLLTRIFYLYADYYLGLACQYAPLSTAGHTGKRTKRAFKSILSSTLRILIVVQLFFMGTRLSSISNVSLRVLGIGIWCIKRNLWVYKYALRQITITNLSCWEGNREVRENSFLC